MERVTVLPSVHLINGWIDPKYLPEGETKYYIRNKQVKKPANGWRHLTSNEIEQLIRNNNTASSWDTIWVTDEFEPSMLLNNRFYGTVRLGRVSDNGLQFHDLRLPVGITNSSIHSCDIGDDCAIHDVHYLSHYIIGDHCMLFNIHEMSCTDHAKFGNGIIKDGESESVRVQLQIMNETGSRQVAPFDGMIAADAYLWAKYIDDKVLQERLLSMTQNSYDHHRGYYGMVGEGCVIKTSSIIKDVKIGEHCYIKGASKLKNITINSSCDESTQIGENVILVNGIVGYGSRIFYGCTAVKFIVGNNCNLKYGVRVIDSILGDNSTVSCCEVLNNLIFPAHEQHHNNSFLIAACVKGQSNMAAGATIGSNHNSRTTDNEVVAGRGFWPGLCTSIKHSSVFASFVLLAKGAYPSELNIPFPFCLVSNDEKKGELVVVPAFWWCNNMYALARNNWKYKTRDKRKTKVQHIEFDSFAPDSMEEAKRARRLLEVWTAKDWYAQKQEQLASDEEELAQKGAKLIASGYLDDVRKCIAGEGLERSLRPVRIVKPGRAYKAYGDMLIHYGMSCVMAYMTAHRELSLSKLARMLDGDACCEWVNMGGQLMPREDVDQLRKDIREWSLSDWAKVHARYDELWERYPMDKLRHAYKAMCEVLAVDKLDADGWKRAIAEEIRIQNYICTQVFESRKKDYLNAWRRATYRNEAEMLASVGPIEDNSFIKQVRSETSDQIEALNALMDRL